MGGSEMYRGSDRDGREARANVHEIRLHFSTTNKFIYHGNIESLFLHSFSTLWILFLHDMPLFGCCDYLKSNESSFSLSKSTRTSFQVGIHHITCWSLSTHLSLPRSTFQKAFYNPRCLPWNELGTRIAMTLHNSGGNILHDWRTLYTFRFARQCTIFVFKCFDIAIFFKVRTTVM